MFNDFGYAEEDKLGKPYDLRLFKKLHPFVKPHLRYLFLAVALMVVITIMELYLPLVLQKSIDNYIIPETIPYSSDSDKRDPVRYLEVDIRSGINEIVEKHKNQTRLNTYSFNYER